MSWLKRRQWIGYRLNRFNPSPCPLALSLYWLPHDVPAGCLLSASCAAIVSLACRFLIRFAHSPRSSVSSYRPAVRVVPLFSARLLVSFRRLAPLCLPIGYVRLVSSSHPLRPPASLCLPSPSLVSPGGASLISLPSRHASRLPPLRACLPSYVPLVFGVRLRMSSLRSCVPLLPCRLCLVSPTRPAVRVGGRGDVGR